MSSSSGVYLLRQSMKWQGGYNIFVNRKALRNHQYKRSFGSNAFKVVRHFCKLRYLIAGTAVGTGVAVKNKVDEWRENVRALSDLSKVKSIVNVGDWNKATQYATDNLTRVANQAKYKLTGITGSVSEIDLKPLNDFKDQLMERWDNAKQAGNEYRNDTHVENVRNDLDLSKIHNRCRKKIEELEKNIRELERQNELIKREMYSKKNVKIRREKKTLVEMYSEVLDELSSYADGWKDSDHLPRVVVVGDQSAGKTSVLEMLAKARIFPRGGGEMMTRTPVKVTLCEGPFHVAQIHGISREFDLRKESDLVELRKTVEMKMSNNVSKGKTVSNNVISMTVKGPGLHKMVLIDLPGIISTQTTDMASDTRAIIREMSQQYMNNPNAIILCIQDGSVDAERSNVTDLVSQCDPTGKRTIFVLTKVDMAEKNATNPERIRQILSGKLFPMKALGYFAVVTGNGNKDDTVQNIKEYEEEYFTKSKLFKGLVKADQVATENLSKAVAERFWKMVEESIEQQYDNFKAKRFNLETEWKNSYSRKQEMDRDELFYRARGEILDRGVDLSQISASVWENTLMDELWKSTSDYVIENIYLPAAMDSQNNGKFNTLVDIALKGWAERSLPQKSMECANKILKSMLKEQLFKDKSSENFDGVYENLKLYVFEEAIKRHSWDKHVMDVLKVLQSKALQDKNLTQKSEWDDATTFLDHSVTRLAKSLDEYLEIFLGPSYFQRLYKWQYLDEEQQRRMAVKNELEFLLNGAGGERHSHLISPEEVIAVRNNLENKGIVVNDVFIRETWQLVHRRYFLKNSLDRARACRKEFYLYKDEETRNQTECNDVVLFWRIKQMLKITSNTLRQQITDAEAQNIQRTIKNILKELSLDSSKKRDLIVGKRVALAEELKRVRSMQEKLEDFIIKLKNEKK